MTERMGLAAVGRQNRQRATLARRAELRPAARRLAAVAVGFAGGWAVVYGALMPFGLGFVLGFAEDCFAPCAAGAALGVLLHGFGALSLRSVCMLCALGAAVAARWMGARTLTPAARWWAWRCALPLAAAGQSWCFTVQQMPCWPQPWAFVCGSLRPKSRVPGCFWWVRPQRRRWAVCSCGSCCRA